MRGLLGTALGIVCLAMTGCQIATKAEPSSGSLASNSFMSMDEFTDELAGNQEVVLVEFCVPSDCPQCNELREPLDRLASDRANHLTVRRLNLDQHLQLAWEFGLTDYPSYVAFRGGEELFRTANPASAGLIASRLDEHLPDSAADQLSAVAP